MSDQARLAGGFIGLSRRASRRRPDGDWLYCGARPRLGDIEARMDAARALLPDLLAALTSKDSLGGQHLIVGRPGSGRTAFLLRLGRELAAEGRRVYLYSPGPDLTTLDRIITETKRKAPTYLLFDDLDMCPEAETILHETSEAGGGFVIIGTAGLDRAGVDNHDDLANLWPAMLTSQGARHRLELRPEELGALATAMRASLPPQLRTDDLTGNLTMLEAARMVHLAQHPDRDWLAMALGDDADREKLLGLVVAGLAETPAPKAALARTAGGRLEAWLRKGLAAGEGTAILAPHSEICRAFLAKTGAGPEQMRAALEGLLAGAGGDDALFAPRLLSRLARLPETRELAAEQLDKRGQLPAPAGPDSPERAAWSVAWQVSGRRVAEQAAATTEAPDLARLLQAGFVAADDALARDLAAKLAGDRSYRAIAAYNAALLQARAGDLEGAQGSAPQPHPLLPHTYFLQGILQESREDHEGAIASYKACVEGEVLPGAAVRRLGYAHLVICAPRAALQLFEAGLKQDPQQAALYAGVAVAHLQLGALEAAQAQGDRAIKAGVSPGQARRAIARAFSDVRAYTRAVAELESCVAAYPDDLEAWRDLADATHWAGDFIREEQALEVLLTAAPEEPGARLQMARCHKDQGRPDEAWSILRELAGQRESTIAAALLTAETAGLVDEAQAQGQAAQAAMALGDGSGWGLFWLAQSQAARDEDAAGTYLRAASVLRQHISDRLPARERARLWEAILIATAYLADEQALQAAAQSACREGQLCEATGAKIDSVIAGRAVSASAFLRELEDGLRTEGEEAALAQPEVSTTTAPQPQPGLAPEPAVVVEPQPAPEAVVAPAAAPIQPLPSPTRQPVGIALTPAEPLLLRGGDSRQFALLLQYDDGSVQDVTERAHWAWSGGAKAGVVSDRGMFVAGTGFGSGVVAATYGGQVASSEIIKVRNAATLTMAPAEPAILAAGGDLQFAAELRYDDGSSEDVTGRARWAWSGDAATGAVSPTGLFTAAEGFGAGAVSAACDGQTAVSAQITVRNTKGLELSPAGAAVLASGESLRFTAALHYSDGQMEDVTRAAEWTWSGEPEVGAVDATGRFTAGEGFGLGLVTATHQDYVGHSAALTVRTPVALTMTPLEPVILARGEEARFAVALEYNDGIVEDVTDQAVWVWDGDPAAGTVSVEGGFVAGEGYGHGGVTAQCRGLTVASAAITVRTPQRLTLSPPTAPVMAAGDGARFTAILHHNDGSEEDVTGRAAWTWTGEPATGAMSAPGVFTAGDGFGPGRIVAVLDNLTVESDVLTVRNGTTLELTPLTAPVMAAGDAVQFGAALHYNDGLSEDVTTQVRWTWTGEVGAGSIGADGRFVAGAGFGRGQVTATRDQWTAASEPITVRNAVALRLAPAGENTLAAGEQARFAARLEYNDGTTEDVSSRCAWAWTGPAEAGRVSDDGLFAADSGFGSGVVRATYEAFEAASDALTVRSVVELVLSEATAQVLAAGDQIRLRAELRYNDGRSEDVTQQAAWTWTGDAAAGSVAEGVFAAGEGFGAGVITAEYRGWSASSEGLTVRNGAGLVLSPLEPALLEAGQTLQFAVILHHNDGASEDVTDLADWAWTGDPAAGAVSPTGLFTAGEGCGAGEVTVARGKWSAHSAELAVRNASQLTLSPVTVEALATGETLHLRATLHYNDATSAEVTPEAAWTWTGETEAGVITAPGLFIAGDGFGSASVAADYRGLTAVSDPITVRNAADLSVTPTEGSVLAAGDEARFVATLAYNDETTEDVTARVAWTWTGEAAAGLVDDAGRFVAGEGFGVGQVTASLGGFTAEGPTLTVRNPASLMLTPYEGAVLAASDTIRFAVTLAHNDGLTEDVTEQVTWGWSGPREAGEITAAVFAAAAGFGVGAVTATLGPLSASSAPLRVRNAACLTLSGPDQTVLAAGDAAQFRATLSYNDGLTEDVTDQAQWTWSGAAEAGEVSGGVFLAGEAFGAGVVAATYNSLAAESVPITVRNPAALSLSPPDVGVLAEGETAQFAATLHYNDGETADVTGEAQWSWTGPAEVGEVSGGRFAAGAGWGVGVVAAAHAGLEAESAELIVRNIAGLSLSPTELGVLTAGQTVRFAATLEFNDGFTAEITDQVAWSWTGEPAAASLSGSGLLAAGEGFGTGQVEAAYGAWIAQSEALTVRNVEALVLSPTEEQVLAEGDQVRFRSILQYNDGTSEDVTAEAAWSWSAGADAGAVDETGQFVAGEGFGAGEITAAYDQWLAASGVLTIRNVTELALTPAEPATLAAGESIQFAATIHYNDGTSADATAQAAWAFAGDEAAGAVNASGLFTAAAGFGAGEVEAAVGSWRAVSGTITVRNVAALALSPLAEAILATGETVQFAATLEYNDGFAEDLTEAATWTWVGEEEAGEVSAEGLFTASSDYGSGHVLATWGDWAAESATLTVRNVAGLELAPVAAEALAAGETIQFAATLTYNDGLAEEVTEAAEWTWSGDPEAGCMTAAGLFAAGEGFGEGTVSVALDGWTGTSATLTVRNAQELALTPGETPALEAGGTVQFAVELRYNDGLSEDVSDHAEWSWSGEPKTGAVTAEGLFTAGQGSGMGVVTVACAGLMAASDSITVRNVAELALTPAVAAVLGSGGTLQFGVELRYDDGTVEDVTSRVEWNWRGDEAAGSVSAGGLFAAGEGHGSGVAEASLGSLRVASEPIVVRNATSLRVSPGDSLALAAGETTAFAAQLHYDDETVEDLTEGVTWEWTGPAEVATITGAGLFTAGEGFGTGEVMAAYEDWTAASATLTVRNVFALALSPLEDAVLGDGDTVQFAAELRFTDDTLEGVTARATWAWTGEESAGAVSPEGLFTAGAGTGVGHVTATLERWSATSAAISVRQVADLSLSPAGKAVLAEGETRQFRAELLYTDGAVEDASATVAWAWGGDPDVGAITAAGLFTAGEGGGTGAVTATLGDWQAISDELTVRSAREMLITPAEPRVLADGEEVEFAAVVSYSDGAEEDVSESVVWSWPGQAQAGEFLADGRFVASLGHGTGPVTAALDDRLASGPELTVRNVLELTLAPSEAPVMGAGDTLELVAELAYNDGHTRVVTHEAAWTWTGGPETGAVSDGVFVAGKGAGQGQVQVTHGALRAVTDLLSVINIDGLAVLPSEQLRFLPGQTRQFSATVRHSDGAWHSLAEGVVWSWSGPAEVGGVDAQGVFRAGGQPGDGTVVAEYAGRTEASGPVMVREPSRLQILPEEPVFLSAGGTQQFRAVLRYPSGSEEEPAGDLVWKWVGPAEAGSLSPYGLFTAGEACGVGVVTVAHEEQEAKSPPVEVRNITGLVVLPSERLSLDPGETQRFSASLRFADGTWGDVTREVEWSWTDSPESGSLNSAGLFTAGQKGGEGTVVAAYPGFRDKSGHIKVRSLVRLELSPAEPAVMYSGDSREFTAIGHYSDGFSEEVTTLADWSWTGPFAAGRFTRRGVFTCSDGSGVGAVKVAYKSQTAATGEIEVRHPLGLQLLPEQEVSLEPAQTTQFRLLVEYEVGKNGGRQRGLSGLFRRAQSTPRSELTDDITGEAEWSWSGDPRAGTISDGGFFRAGDVPEVARVTASYRGQRAASAFITIKAVAPEVSAEPGISQERIRQRLSRVIADVRVAQVEVDDRGDT